MRKTRSYAADLALYVLGLSMYVAVVAAGPQVGDLDQVPDFHGPFIVTVKARFDDLTLDKGWQRIFDFGNGRGIYNVFAAQYKETNNMWFAVYGGDGDLERLIVRNAIVEGELATWRFGVDADRLMWIEKNGVRQQETNTGGMLPPNVTRTSKLFGQANWMDNTPDLVGLVSGFQVHHQLELKSLQDLKFNNYPGQIFAGAFTASAHVRFDDHLYSPYQRYGFRMQHFSSLSYHRCLFLVFRVFDFSNGNENDQVWFGTKENNSNDLYFEIHNKGESPSTLVAPGAIIDGEMALYRAGVDASGTMFIEKNDVVLNTTSGSLPSSVFRKILLIGQSNFGGGKLRGVVLGLRVELPTDPS